MTSQDDDALSWAGDEDRLTSGASGKPQTNKRGASSVKQDSGEDSPANSLSSVALIGFGVFAGIYLLFSVAWLITAMRNTKELSDVFANFMFQAGIWACVLAPALWFGAVLFLARGKSAARHFLWLFIGVIVLIPWPYVTWVG